MEYFRLCNDYERWLLSWFDSYSWFMEKKIIQFHIYESWGNINKKVCYFEIFHKNICLN